MSEREMPLSPQGLKEGVVGLGIMFYLSRHSHAFGGHAFRSLIDVVSF